MNDANTSDCPVESFRLSTSMTVHTTSSLCMAFVNGWQWMLLNTRLLYHITV